MALLGFALASLVLWLAFPKGFKYLVGSWVGAMGGATIWGLFVLTWSVGLGRDMSWAGMAWSFIVSVVAGILGGCVLAARG